MIILVLQKCGVQDNVTHTQVFFVFVDRIGKFSLEKEKKMQLQKQEYVNSMIKNEFLFIHTNQVNT